MKSLGLEWDCYSRNVVHVHCESESWFKQGKIYILGLQMQERWNMILLSTNNPTTAQTDEQQKPVYVAQPFKYQQVF